MTTLRRLLPWLICSTIFMQGLYFNPYLFGALGVVLLMLFYVVSGNKKLILPKDKGFYFFIFFFLAYGLGYAFFIEKGMLIFELLKMLLYISFYLLIVQFDTSTIIEPFKKAYVYLSLVGAFISLLSYFFGLFPSLNYVIKGRLSGPLQYANTNGILLLLAVLFLFTLELKLTIKIPAALLLLTPMILTMSRSSMLFGLIMVVLYLLFVKHDKETFIVIVTSTIVSIVIVVLFDQGGALNRLSESNLNVSEWQTRLLYYKDAITMIKAKPMGYGPYGYYYAQRAFQTGSTYYVKFAHSSLIQAFLDIGIIGGLLFAGFGIYVVFIRKVNKISRIGLAILLGHSLIDIDMAFGLVWLLAILMMLDGYQGQISILKLSGKSSLSVRIGIGLLCLITVYAFVVELHFASSAYRTVYKLYPFHTEAMRHDIGQLDRPDENLIIAKRLSEHQPYIIKSYKVLYNDAMIRGDIEEGLYYSRMLVRLNVLNIDYYEALATTLRILGESYLKDGQSDKARMAFEEITEMPARLEQLAKEKKTDYNVKHVPSLTMTEELVKQYLIASQWLETLAN